MSLIDKIKAIIKGLLDKRRKERKMKKEMDAIKKDFD